jgi:hypothetical protein
MLEQQAIVARKKSGEPSRTSRTQFVRRFRRLGTVVVLFGLLVLSAGRLQAQSTFASVRGTAQDTTGAAIPDTQITLHDTDTNTDRVVKTDATGAYAFENVLAGKYSIRAQHDGFADTVVSGLNGIPGGWSINTITLLETCPYLTATDSVGKDQTNTDPSEDRSIVRPDRAPNVSLRGGPNGAYFNYNAFIHTPQNAGRVGNAGVGILEAPGTIAVSAGLAKLITVHDDWRLRFGSTFTNVLNRTNFAPPATNFSDQVHFGVLVAAQTAENAGNHTEQVALRLEF